jgi:hypothetical protein
MSEIDNVLGEEASGYDEEQLALMVMGLRDMLIEDGYARTTLRERLDESPNRAMDPDRSPGRFYFIVGLDGAAIEVLLDMDQIRRIVLTYAILKRSSPKLYFGTVVQIAMEEERREARRHVSRTHRSVPS